MLLNKMTKGYLSFNLGDRVKSIEEAYSTTSNPKTTEPVARSMFIIKRVEEDDGYAGDEVRYG